jgi:hypothetical protein
MDYFDILLAKKLEDDRDPKVEGLSVSANGRYHEDGVVYDPVIVNVPETPLSKLTVTENGTYTAPSGTAYNEVEVDVPLPENAYLLKDIPNTPTAIATFSDGANLPMPKLEVGIEPVQEGSGDPSPTNIRPISGWSAVDVNVSPNRLIGAEWKDGYFINASGQEQSNYLYKYTTTMINVKPSTTYYVQMNYQSIDELAISVPYYNNNGEFISRDIVTQFNTRGIHGGQFTTPNNCYGIRVSLPLNSKEWNLQEGASIVADNTYTLDLDGTRYGGKVDLVSGVMTVDRVSVNLSTLSWNYDGNNVFWAPVTGCVNNTGVGNVPNTLCDRYTVVASRTYSDWQLTTDDKCFSLGYDSARMYVRDSAYNDVTAFKNSPTNSQLVYELATPLTYQLPTTVVKSLRGMNNVSADSGNILDLSYLAKEE